MPFRWPELADRLERGDFDVAMSGVTVRGDRLARSPMTMPVARTEAVLVVPAGTPRFDLARNGAGLRVAVNHGGHMERIARSMLPAAGIEPVDDNRSLADLLARGRVDAVVIDAAELASFYPDPDGQMPQVAAVLSRDRKAWWVTRGDPALADDLDAWIAEREADGTLPALRTLTVEISPAAPRLEALPALLPHLRRLVLRLRCSLSLNIDQIEPDLAPLSALSALTSLRVEMPTFTIERDTLALLPRGLVELDVEAVLDRGAVYGIKGAAWLALCAASSSAAAAAACARA